MDVQQGCAGPTAEAQTSPHHFVIDLEHAELQGVGNVVSALMHVGEKRFDSSPVYAWSECRDSVRPLVVGIRAS